MTRLSIMRLAPVWCIFLFATFFFKTLNYSFHNSTPLTTRSLLLEVKLLYQRHSNSSTLRKITSNSTCSSKNCFVSMKQDKDDFQVLHAYTGSCLVHLLICWRFFCQNSFKILTFTTPPPMATSSLCIHMIFLTIDDYVLDNLLLRVKDPPVELCFNCSGLYHFSFTNFTRTPQTQWVYLSGYLLLLDLSLEVLSWHQTCPKAL